MARYTLKGKTRNSDPFVDAILSGQEIEIFGQRFLVTLAGYSGWHPFLPEFDFELKSIGPKEKVRYRKLKVRRRCHSTSAR